MLDENGGRTRREVPWRLAPGTEVAGFIIEELIASGSFGTVYRAKRSERRFAIKLVPMDPRGDREVAALRQVRHPNVVSFHGYGLWPEDEPRFLVLALELVEGRPLDTWASEENPSALRLVMQVLLPFTLTLADVHASGVVHRDIKEANIVVREVDGQPVLVDFGAAGLEGTPRLTVRMPPGTAEYRSPEALRFAREWEGEAYPFTPGDDLWAQGVVTYWLLTRTLPFGNRNDPEMHQAILHEPPPAPHELNPRVPRALGELCMRMLEKAPEARFADARELADALVEEWAQADRSWRVPLFPEDGRGRTPSPPLLAARTYQVLASRRGAGLVLASVLVGLGVSSWEMPSGQRMELHHSPPPPQASFRQEIAPGLPTGEVVHSAEPHRSPTPAPVAPATHNEDPKMMKSQKTLSLTAATLIATCMSAGCASAPVPVQPAERRMRRVPPPEDCPPGSLETAQRYNLYGGVDVKMPPYRSPYAILKEGDVIATTLLEWESLPGNTEIHGRLIFLDGWVYGRFTKIRMPDGSFQPVCMSLMDSLDVFGMPMEPGSTSETARLANNGRLTRMTRFEEFVLIER